MSKFETYRDQYRDILLRREDGILEVLMKSEGWRPVNGLHEQLVSLFREIADDPDNAIVILSGVGDVYSTGFNMEGLPPLGSMVVTPEAWDRSYRTARAMIDNLLAIEIPVIGAVNGPAFIHAEILVMSDIVIASEKAAFADKAHMPANVVPGDGVHVWWPMLLGPNRARYFLLMGEEIGAEEAKRLDIVGELVPHDQLMDRAWAIARELLQRPPRALRYSRHLLTREIRRKMIDELGYGMMLEGMALITPATAKPA